MRFSGVKHLLAIVMAVLFVFSCVGAFAEGFDDLDLEALGCSDLRSLISLKTNCDLLKVRKSPNGNTIGRISGPGAELEFLGFSGKDYVGWIRICYEGNLEGWVYAKFVDIMCMDQPVPVSTNRDFLLKLLDKAAALGIPTEMEHSDEIPILGIYAEPEPIVLAEVGTDVAPLPDEDVAVRDVMVAVQAN